MELIKADAERRDPQHRKPLVVLLDGALGLWHLAPQLFKPWQRVTCVLDIMHVVSSLWTAAHALFPAGSRAGKHWVQQQLTAMLSGRVGYVIGGLRQLLTQRSNCLGCQGDLCLLCTRHLLILPGQVVFHQGIQDRP
jgi:hypothetical protein